MSLPKILFGITLILFSAIGVAAWLKTDKKQTPSAQMSEAVAYEVDLDDEIQDVVTSVPEVELTKIVQPEVESHSTTVSSQRSSTEEPPEANRIEELFNIVEPKLPIVETIVYKSRVDWQKGRPAWLSDYASHYKTSRHFIARSLNGKPEYLKQDVSEGDRFNVFKLDKNFSFHLLIDIQRAKMWFFTLDDDTKIPTLIKTYTVGLGRVDSGKASGYLTPIGTYSLGSKVAIYKPKTIGNYNGDQVEMIKVFGTRWIPFDKEIKDCTAPAKGFGIHGIPCTANDKGIISEDLASLGSYQSDGCIRLASQDIEEIFAIVITKPCTVELVKDYYDSKILK